MAVSRLGVLPTSLPSFRSGGKPLGVLGGGGRGRCGAGTSTGRPFLGPYVSKSGNQKSFARSKYWRRVFVLSIETHT